MNISQQIRKLSLILMIVHAPLISAQSFSKIENRPIENRAIEKPRQEKQSLFSRSTKRNLTFRRAGETVNYSNSLSNGQPMNGIFDPEFAISAGLPHLRMDLRITSVELDGPLFVPVGDFVVNTYLISDAHVENAWSADNVPTVQSPAEDNGTITHDTLILSALVYNGCDDSTVINVSSNGPTGPLYLMNDESGAILFSTVTGEMVEYLVLEDSVQGPGFYEFSFKFDSFDTDWIIRGEAPVYCTASTEPLQLD